MAEILAVCISEKKGEQKHPVDQVELKENWGIVGDAHAGNWHRQVSLLGQESVDKLQSKITHVTLKPGDFAENILVKGITLYELPVGTRLKIGPEAVGNGRSRITYSLLPNRPPSVVVWCRVMYPAFSSSRMVVRMASLLSLLIWASPARV